MAVKSGALGRDTVVVVYINTMKTTLHFNFYFNHSLKQSIATEFGRTTGAVDYIDKIKTSFDFNFDL